MSQYERKATYAIDPIHQLLTTKDKKVLLDGDTINARSLRYDVFKKSVVCVGCGIEGAYYAKERDKGSDGGYHLNLYAVDEHGHSILMTKDHIIPKSLGGSNNIKNLQTMCTTCNCKKGNMLDNSSNARIMDA